MTVRGTLIECDLCKRTSVVEDDDMFEIEVRRPPSPGVTVAYEEPTSETYHVCRDSYMVSEDMESLMLLHHLSLDGRTGYVGVNDQGYITCVVLKDEMMEDEIITASEIPEDLAGLVLEVIDDAR